MLFTVQQLTFIITAITYILNTAANYTFLSEALCNHHLQRTVRLVARYYLIAQEIASNGSLLIVIPAQNNITVQPFADQ
jgi:hypothetical protein